MHKHDYKYARAKEINEFLGPVTLAQSLRYLSMASFPYGAGLTVLEKLEILGQEANNGMPVPSILPKID